MMDVFAVVIPLFALALWIAAETRKGRRSGDKNAGQVHINLKYTMESLTQDNYPSTAPFTFSYPSSFFSTWVGSQDYILVFLAPINLITCAFFLVLYGIRTVKVEYIPATAESLLLIAYALIVCAAVRSMRVTTRHAESSLIVAIMGTLCALEYLAPLIIPEGYELLIARAVLDTWGNFLAVYLLTVLPREFSSEEKNNEAYIEEAFQSGNAAEPPAGFSFTRENIMVGLLMACSLITSMLVVVPDWHHKLWVMIGFEISISLSIVLGLALAVITLFKVREFSQRGAYISGISTRWLLMAVILGGVLMRHVYDAAATSIAIYNEVYVPLVSSKAFISWWKETFTLIIPLGFLLSYIINKAVQDRADKIQSAFTISKVIFCAYLLALHLVAVGLFVETTQYSFTLSCAFIIALLSTTNISLILFTFVPPVSHFCGHNKYKVDVV